VPLRLHRALQSRVEAPLFRKPCTKIRGFFDLGCCIKLAEHAGVSLRLHRALQSRVEAPLFEEPLQKCEGFFDLGCCINLAEHAGVSLTASTFHSIFEFDKYAYGSFTLEHCIISRMSEAVEAIGNEPSKKNHQETSEER
jgi:hypothetical protein